MHFVFLTFNVICWRVETETEPDCLCLPRVPDSEVVRREVVVRGHHDGFEVRMSGEGLTGEVAG